jgi:hypothetical protein
MVPVEIFLKQDLGKRFSIKVAGGIDFYRATTNYSYSEIISGEIIPRQAEIKDKGIGWHVRLRPEVFLSKNKNFSLVFEIKFFSIDLEGFPPDENGNLVKMRRFMGKDNYASVYGSLGKVIRSRSKPINGYQAGLGVKFTVSNKKPIPPIKPGPSPSKKDRDSIKWSKICYQVRKNESVCIGKPGAAPPGATILISFKGQTSSDNARTDGSFRISCSELKADKGDWVKVTVNGKSRKKRAVSKCPE